MVRACGSEEDNCNKTKSEQPLTELAECVYVSRAAAASGVDSAYASVA